MRQGLNRLHHIEQYVTTHLQRPMRPPRELSVQKVLLESDGYWGCSKQSLK